MMTCDHHYDDDDGKIGIQIDPPNLSLDETRRHHHLDGIFEMEGL